MSPNQTLSGGTKAQGLSRNYSNLLPNLVPAAGKTVQSQKDPLRSLWLGAILGRISALAYEFWSSLWRTSRWTWSDYTASGGTLRKASPQSRHGRGSCDLPAGWTSSGSASSTLPVAAQSWLPQRTCGRDSLPRRPTTGHSEWAGYDFPLLEHEQG